VTLPVDTPIGEAALTLARTGLAAVVVLAHDGAVLAAVSIGDVRRVGRRQRWTTRVSDLLPQLGGVVLAAASLTDVRREMVRRSVTAVAVVDGQGLLVGLLTFEAIDRRIELADLVAQERSLWRMDSTLPVQSP
jgi:CBS domain-containing protein